MSVDPQTRKPEVRSCEAGKARRTCFNPKVLAGLAVAGVVVWAIAPNLALAALPFLFILACPLSMWLMMRGMNAAHASEAAGPRDHAQPAPVRSLPELKARLASLDAEQEALGREISRRQAPAGAGEKPDSQAARER